MKVSGRVFVLGVSLLSLSTTFRLDFGTKISKIKYHNRREVEYIKLFQETVATFCLPEHYKAKT